MHLLCGLERFGCTDFDGFRTKVVLVQTEGFVPDLGEIQFYFNGHVIPMHKLTGSHTRYQKKAVTSTNAIVTLIYKAVVPHQEPIAQFYTTWLVVKLVVT